MILVEYLLLLILFQEMVESTNYKLFFYLFSFV